MAKVNIALQQMREKLAANRRFEQKLRVAIMLIPIMMTGAMVTLLSREKLTVDRTTVLSPETAAGLIAILAGTVGMAAILLLTRNRTRQPTAERNSRVRLVTEVETITTRGTILLTAGCVVGAGGVGLLLYGDTAFVLPKDSSFDQQLVAIGLHFLPRLSLLIVVELLAFFFLRLFRTTFQQSRWCHEELDRVEMFDAILKSASTNCKDEALANVLIGLAGSIHEHSQVADRESDSNAENTLKEAVRLIETVKKGKVA